MPNEHLEHQANELAKAFADVINVENTKAKREVLAILSKVVDREISPLEACIQLSDWAGK